MKYRTKLTIENNKLVNQKSDQQLKYAMVGAVGILAGVALK
tara:strand:+ start:184 stop:306 length:123 start_codon:yes stop_codon:yes gene_type:complete